MLIFGIVAKPIAIGSHVIGKTTWKFALSTLRFLKFYQPLNSGLLLFEYINLQLKIDRDQKRLIHTVIKSLCKQGGLKAYLLSGTAGTFDNGD